MFLIDKKILAHVASMLFFLCFFEFSTFPNASLPLISFELACGHCCFSLLIKLPEFIHSTWIFKVTLCSKSSVLNILRKAQKHSYLSLSLFHNCVTCGIAN